MTLSIVLVLYLQEEINEIPFFDLELPREIGIRIFRHLSPSDLCRCSLVSFLDGLVTGHSCMLFAFENMNSLVVG